MDAECNDPRCPLNRRGISHRPHDVIERDMVVDPCNDPKCALTRLGMPHNSHGPMDGPAARPSNSGGTKGRAAGCGEPCGRPGGPGSGAGNTGGEAGGPGGPGRNSGGGGGSAGNTGGEAGRPGAAGSATSPRDILDEAARHLRERGAGAGRGPEAASSGPSAPEDAERILRASEPHDVLGVPPGAAISHIRSRYKWLVKRHDAARGIIHKSAPERERSSMIMAKINDAFEAIKSARGASG